MHPLRILRPTYLWAAVLIACGSTAAHGQTISSITNTSPSGGLNGLAWIGLAGDRVHIYGNNFNISPVTAVRFNGVSSTIFAATTPSIIQAYIPAGAANSTNVVQVQFLNGTTINSPQNFIVPPSGPYVRSFTPIAGNTGTEVFISGTRLSGVTSVQFNGITGTALDKSNGDSLIKVTAPPGVTSGPLTVISNSFQHVTSSNFFAPPTVAGFSPSFGSTGTNVVITGSNLDGATGVQFGALTASSFYNLSPTQLVAVVPNLAINGKITVFAPAGSDVTSSNFVILPTIGGFSPTNGNISTEVTISGANLNEGSGPAGAPSVFFNGTPSALVTSVSFNQLKATVPSGATTGKISVTTTNGSGTNDSLFYLPPIITGFTPATNPPGSRIMISGTNFTGATAVTFYSGILSPSFTVTNDRIIGAEIPAGLLTGPISVTGPAGTGISIANYYGPPSISGLSPGIGIPGNIITISGSSFQGVSSIRFTAPGGFVTAQKLSPALPVNFMNVVVPTNGITGPVSVVTPGGLATSPVDFYYNYETLELTVTDSPDPLFVNSQLTYNIAVKNLGPGSAENVIVTNTLPSGVIFVSASTGATVGGVTTANLGTVNAGNTANLSITARPTNGGVTVTNVTRARSGLNPVPVTVTVGTSVTNGAPQLSISHVPPNSVTLSWPLTASNYQLQSSTNLGGGSGWSTVPTPPATNGSSLTLTNSTTGTTVFYQLQP